MIIILSRGSPLVVEEAPTTDGVVAMDDPTVATSSETLMRLATDADGANVEFKMDSEDLEL